MARQAEPLTPDQTFAVETYNRDLQTLEARARAAESVVHVHASKADENDKYKSLAGESQKNFDSIMQELEEMRSNPPNFEDKSGTRAGLSDVFGNFAKNARVANAGGIGIEGSNSTEGGDQAEDPEDAGIEVDIGPVMVHGRGGRAETMAGSRLVEHPDDEAAREEASNEEEETTSPRTRRRRKAAAKRSGRASSRAKASEDEE
jgi:hypothetical protein